MVLGKIKGTLKNPEQITYQVIQPFQRFFRNEASSSILLIASTVAAIVMANSIVSETYHHFWETKAAISVGGLKVSRTLHEWISEGLMAIFFFVVGLEIKREVLVGELSSLRKAMLPVWAAVGGMLLPALIYYGFTAGTPQSAGWGIPMATDIAFALGILFLLGNRVPLGLGVFLSALAIADDLGAVLVIAIFYTKEVVTANLVAAGLVVLALAVANFFWIRNALIYGVLAIMLWLAVMGSGLHATVAGIVVAMFIPARGKYNTDRFIEEVGQYMGKFGCPVEGCGESIMLNSEHLYSVQSIELACHDVETPLQRLEHWLHPWVVFAIIPVFAMANAGVSMGDTSLSSLLSSRVALGVMLGLAIGKPLGIVFFSWLSVRFRMAVLPEGVRFSHILGAGILAGIGFTMSMFITQLSFTSPVDVDFAKMGILASSFICSVAGYAFLSRCLVKSPSQGKQ